MTTRTGGTPARSRTKTTASKNGGREADEAMLREVLDALLALKQGDVDVRLPTRRAGLSGRIATAFNDCVALIDKNTSEIERISRLVGREGRMSERMGLPGSAGAWTTRANAINALIDDLIRPTTEIARVIEAVARGDLSQKVALSIEGRPLKGEYLRIGRAVNAMVDQLSSFGAEVSRVAKEVGTDGKLGGQAKVKGVSGTWKDLTDNVNLMASNLTAQVRDIAQVATAVAKGDLSQKITVDVKGEILELKDTINTMVDQLSSFADEVTRVAREVGTDGKLGGQANVKGVSGTWKDLTDSVNVMASNLTGQVRNIAQVASAVARGDLSQKITVGAKGEVAALADTINSMTDTLRVFGDEVTRVAREVGTEGRLGGQADVPGVAGTWKDLTDNVNSMASNLTGQVRNIAQVATAVAKGDLSQKITVDVRGEILQLKNTINTMVDQLSSFADEVTRVAREVGTEGGLGGQAHVKGVSGTWKDLTDNVNSMASNLTSQVRDIARVTTAVAGGDLSQKITVDVKGEILELKNTINTMVDQLRSFADEVTRVAREVGTEGKLGGQAEVFGVSGTWKGLTDNVNFMASNLTAQVRNIAQVATAVAKGDLSQKVTVDVKGEIAELKDTINTMVDQLGAFAAEVTRVAREVGTEGKLGGQAEVLGVAGTWKDLTDNVNFMASNLTSQVRDIAHVTTAVARGDLSQTITVDVKGEIAELKNTINTMVDQLSSFADEVTRVAREVGTEGKLGGQAQVPGVGGTWKDLTENVNSMASNLTGQVRNIAQVTTAVAKGDLSQKITVDVKGEILELKDTINTMVDQLGAFAAEATRVAREVGTEGKLGGQANVPGVSGTWKDLTDSVNFMASNLTSQVRNIAHVATAVAGGDLSQKITVDVKGEILELKKTINTMVDQLSSFAAEVTRVAHEVGTEGILGGQAEVEDVSGTWRHLTESVNQLAQNLTTQVRAIADVATAVTQGDLTRAIDVEAQGEVADLKDNINQMIRNLQETTQKNAEQDWLKSNLARISGMMQGQRDLRQLSRLIMSEVTPVVSAQHGAFFMANGEGADLELTLIASYASASRKKARTRVRIGEGLVGQAAAERAPLVVTDPPADYVRLSSGLGEAPPAAIIALPVVFEGQVLAVIELASFRPFSDVSTMFLEQLVETTGVVLNGVIANMRTEELLAESQRLARELQSQSLELQQGQEQLRQTNAELEEKARLLEEQNRNIELKNREIEVARKGLEDKAHQLALASNYKSEFLANMSHELRTPLNSLMVLAQLLASNPDGTLKPKQVEFAHTIYDAGKDLLLLINDILDLSKVEAGRLDILPARVPVDDVRESIEQAFRPLAEQKGLSLEITIGTDCPPFLRTDPQRLQQVLNNLLSNAVKFTNEGGVSVRIGQPPDGVAFTTPQLQEAGTAIAFTVSDTGIGIAPDQLDVIFEPFRQADGTASRRFGGTGLGLSITREVARLLGGELRVDSSVDEGSTFTLFLPLLYVPVEPTLREALRRPAEDEQAEPVDAGDETAVPRRVLLFEADLTEDESVAAFLRGQAGTTVTEAATIGEAVAYAEAAPFDHLVLHAAAEESRLLLEKLPSSSKQSLAVHAYPFAQTDAEIFAREGVAIVDSLTDLAEALRPTRPASGPAIAAAPAAPVPDGSLSGKSILVVEDDVRNVFALTNALENHGMSVLFAQSGSEALDVLYRNPDVDLILMDIMMPGIDGFETTRQIRGRDQFVGLPIIALTAKAMKGDRERTLAAGATDYIAKPVEMDELLSKIHACLYR
jgi:HAMP domain-containing protein/signal transduction histidine kinase/CheY-like chemotaxis protein